ncbi:uncharacterized protein LOC126284968 [Schistocerca gregaria]|uniref:uncharacterized protein LOC126284968 n=1 Tax=Schistocerca gregaria TaxID=7010 RepID=UPI00211F3936|nr:uncharacterized protein LOC126284968 [Schistocerca gregaria]
MNIELLLKVCCWSAALALVGGSASPCRGPAEGTRLKYVWGDALTDHPDCRGPTGQAYPISAVTRAFRGSSRSGRAAFGPLDPQVTRRALLQAHEAASNVSMRAGRADTGSCSSMGSSSSRLCRTRYNTTAPMYGVSLTSGQPVTIVQKFPDLLQQVVFEVCDASECEVVRGECTQTYVPYLFLVIPLGPVTLTGQDYVLVESGCVCKPKFSANSIEHQPPDISALPPLL